MRELHPGQCTRVHIGGPGLERPCTVLSTDAVLLEAPNWYRPGGPTRPVGPDGVPRVPDQLLLNGDGLLWSVDLDRADLHGSGLRHLDFPGLPPINNDHVLDPDGEHILMSAADGHVYRGRVSGGTVTRVTHGPGLHFLHGISPDGEQIAYVLLGEDGVGRVELLDLRSGSVDRIDTGRGHTDGPEYSPDGRHLLVNTEAFTEAPGHAQLAQVDLTDAARPLSRLVRSGTVDWFPHLSPSAAHASYVAFPPGTRGHPENREVEVRVVRTDDWSQPLRRYPVSGGQGTLNVASWSPGPKSLGPDLSDQELFAFVSYPCGRASGTAATIEDPVRNPGALRSSDQPFSSLPSPPDPRTP
jgi:hypothetical protein